MFDTLIVCLKGFFDNIDFEKKSDDDKKAGKNFPGEAKSMTLVIVIQMFSYCISNIFSVNESF